MISLPKLPGSSRFRHDNFNRHAVVDRPSMVFLKDVAAVVYVLSYLAPRKLLIAAWRVITRRPCC